MPIMPWRTTVPQGHVGMNQPHSLPQCQGEGEGLGNTLCHSCGSADVVGGEDGETGPGFGGVLRKGSGEEE